MEKAWKTASTESCGMVKDLEDQFITQKIKVNEMLFNFSNKDRGRILKECSGNSFRARKNFWSHVSTKVKEESCISAVVDPVSGTLKCNADEIKDLVEDHFCAVFQGSLEPVDVPDDKAPPVFKQSVEVDHCYSVNPNPRLIKLNDGASLEEDPSSWLNI